MSRNPNVHGLYDSSRGSSSYAQVPSSESRSNSQESLTWGAPPPGPERGISLMASPPNPNGAPPSLGQILFPRFHKKSFTFIISMIQVVVFIATLIVGGTMFGGAFVSLEENQLGGPDSQTLVYMGGKWDPDIWKGQVWRLLTPVFLHAGLLHILSNLFFQFRVGFVCELRWGIPLFATCYFVAGIGGALLSAVASVDSVSVGASGALFGILGADLAYLIYNWPEIPQRGAELCMLSILIIVNLLVGLGHGVDNWAHFGGLVTGAFVGAAILPAIFPRPRKFNLIWRGLGWFMLLSYMMLFSCLLFLVVKQKHQTPT